MFSSRKRVFAGKASLHSEPLCPIITDASGFAGLAHKSVNATRYTPPPNRKSSRRDGRRYA